MKLEELITDLEAPLLDNQSRDRESPLDRFYDYFIKEMKGDPIPFGKMEAAQLATGILGGSAGIYYGPSAYEYAKNAAPWLKYSLALCNPVSGGLFLTKAADDFMESSSLDWKVPAPLEDLIELPSKSEWLIHQLKILFGSAICSVPFGVATYLFPLPGCESTTCVAVTVAHSGSANIILHGISWGLILTPQFWYYRIPYLPFEKAFALYKRSRLTPEERHLSEIQQQRIKIYKKYKNSLSQFLITASEKIVNDSKNRAEKVKEVTSSSASIYQLAGASLDTLSPTAQTTQNPWRLWCLCTAVDSFLRKGVINLTGQLFMAVGCMGWVANPIYLASVEGLNPYESALIGGLPAYSMLVLGAFYGAFTVSQIYDYLFTNWSRPSDKVPLEAKFYPKTFTLFLMINAYISIFSYATAEQLVATVFSDEIWNAYRPLLEDVAYPAMQSLTFVSLLSLFNTVLRKSVAKFGKGDDQQMASRFMVKIDLMAKRLQQMKGDQLMLSLQQCTSEQREFLGINSKEFKKDQRILDALDHQRIESTDNDSCCTQSGNCFSFLSNNSKQEPLLSPKGSVSLQVASDALFV